MDHNPIVIVSGLPRSGTSMMMKMLEAGGLEPLMDGIRSADADNPKGYYEFEAVKQLERDQSWLPEAQGRVVKVISALLKHLPPAYTYRVIFVRRKMAEILASQKQMLVRRGEPTDRVSDEQMAALFEKHLAQVEAWLAAQPNFEVLYVNHHDVIQSPRALAEQVNQFLDGSLDVERMAAVVDPTLYRQRR
jgi:hypothetical protein